ncbi:MAG: hypothetical protein ACRCZF_20410 [Gemmataceae bacterium]
MDLYYALAHLSDAVKTLKLTAADAERLRATGRQALLTEGKVGIERWIGETMASVPEEDSTAGLLSLAAYLANHPTHLDYGRRLSRGESIGLRGLLPGQRLGRCYNRHPSASPTVLPMPAFLLSLALLTSAPPVAPPGPIVAPPLPLTTYDGRHAITTIHLTVVYFVPKDRPPLPDWKDRVDYYTRRIAAFHSRELDGQSKLVIATHPKPLVTPTRTADFRRGDQNRTFFKTMDEVKAQLPWVPDRSRGFPVLLVLSDFNWRELDDFQRTRQENDRTIQEGHIRNDGRHFPGAESGGSRATYIADPGYGMGLVSGDGWRVPYAGGSDCVIYHEGLGHSIGLPHPEPVDDSVMGVAQYQFWINEAKLNLGQKKKLGWVAPEKRPDRRSDLFTHFVALQSPMVPKQNEPVELKLTWPTAAKVKELKIQTQTELLGKWEAVPVKLPEDGTPPARVPLKAFEQKTPVSYRVDAKLADGQTAEIWGYFWVK